MLFFLTGLARCCIGSFVFPTDQVCPILRTVVFIWYANLKCYLPFIVNMLRVRRKEMYFIYSVENQV